VGDLGVGGTEGAGPLTSSKTYPVLPLWERLAILVIAVTQFLIGHGRIWTKPFDWDRSILLSYLTIPILVAVALVLRKQLRLISWGVHTLELVGIKFILTATILLVVLVTLHPKPAPPPSPVVQEAAPPRPVPVSKPLSVIPEAMRVDVEGTVTRGGAGVPGALVFVSGGLEDLVFEAPAAPFTLENNGSRFIPGLGAVQTGQVFAARSTNHQLHTLLMTKLDRSWVFNIPMLASGAERSLKFDEPKGLVSVHCTVHGKREGEAHLAILNHPFFTFTDQDGNFHIRRVPIAASTLSAFAPTLGENTSRLDLKRVPPPRVALSLP
jgi:hypothetical protein